MRQYLLSGSDYGKLILLIGVLVGVPLLVLLFYTYELWYAFAFLIPMFFSFALGTVICAKTYLKKRENISEWRSPLQRGSLPVLFVWAYSFLIGAVPFVIGGQLDFVHALFESVSGWTTTGLTIVDVTKMPHIFLFHRSFMQYCGGIGFILMMVMIIQGNQAMYLYSAEGHLDRLMPSLKQTSRIIFSMYIGLLILGSALYRFFGMELFDAICHAMSALSTAGFTTMAGSIGEYGSLSIEILTIVLMLIGASNFAVLLLLTRGAIRQILRVTEMRIMAGLMAVFVPLIAISLAAELGLGFGESIRHSLFGVVTTFSTTGYSTMNYAKWPPFAMGLLILLMFVGGSSGSTAGGIKLSRVYLLLRITRESVRKRLSPARMVTFPTYNSARGKTRIDEALILDTFGFIACYMGVYIVGTFAVSLTANCSLFDAMFEFASALGTAGISIGITNVNTNTGTLIVEMFGMILGRLEILIVFVGLHSSFKLLKAKILRGIEYLREKKKVAQMR